jgi:uncharacterized protein YbjQ (UPF0145 family)
MAIPVVTTPNIEGRPIAEYLGIVFSKGADSEEVVADMAQQAEDLGADAVVGFRADVISPKRFFAQGTAVKLA